MFVAYLDLITDNMGFKDSGIVEKDYYVTLFLKHLAQKQTDLVFKGGTCLSKAFKIINRFSEYIDLTLFEEVKRIGDGKRKRFKQAIVSVAEEFGFPIINLHKTQSDRDFNEYQIALISSILASFNLGVLPRRTLGEMEFVFLY